MIVRLGYVAIALKLPKVTSSSSVTYATYQKLNTEEKRINKLKQVTLSNLNDLYKILKYNVENQIEFYRITSQLIPLATHPEVTNWNYRDIFKPDFIKIGEYINTHNMRVDTHPDQFNVINSTNEEVVANTQRNLMYHVNFFKDINYDNAKMVLHVGSSQGGKDNALKRFEDNFKKYPSEITSKLILENDDKTFTTREVLNLCNKLNVPMVLDVHHHLCNDGGDNLSSMLNDILNTWNEETLPPKLHFSSPKEGAKDRKHADFINIQDFIEFIELCKPIDKDLDIMIEAKQKDLALYELVHGLKSAKKNIKWVNKFSFEI